MMAIRDWPFRSKLMLLGMLPTTVGLVLACLAFTSSLYVRFPSTLEQQLSYVGDIVGQNSTAALLFQDPELAHQILTTLSASPNIVAACLYDLGGTPFAKFHALRRLHQNTDGIAHHTLLALSC